MADGPFGNEEDVKHEVNSVKTADHKIRWMLLLEDDPSEAGSDQARNSQYLFLQLIANQPQLTFCGLNRFEKLTISHNGTAWQAAGIAIEQLPVPEPETTGVGED